MADLYKNKYRIPSARRPNWDYGQNAAYFVTICTQGRVCYFGDVTDGNMHLSEMGEIVKLEWLKTPQIRPDMNLFLDAWVVMPNHFHAIICIGDNEYNTGDGDGGDRDGKDAMHRVSTFEPQSKNLSSIIRGFKSAVTGKARQIHADFAWQPRFHDHIIRNNDSYQRIRDYIINNPNKWGDDKFYPDKK